VNSLHACNRTTASYRTHSVHKLVTGERHEQEGNKDEMKKIRAVNI
jgi:hypothetical protein